MPLYKVTKVFMVTAGSKEEAVELVTKRPGELLEFVSVIQQGGPEAEAGWKAWRKALGNQLAGKKRVER